jgi:nitronate monooxygenase
MSGPMMISTRLTEKLGVKHPIMLAPMDLIADARLAMAVSRAGGFGMIGGGYGEEVWLKTQLDGVGEERVGVGFITWSLAKNPCLLDLALDVVLRRSCCRSAMSRPSRAPSSKRAQR